jgi:hypothetical protein
MIPVDPSQTRPGDIILVGPARDYVSPEGVRKRHGRHIAVVESVDVPGRVAYTIEGNTVGVFPSGKKKHGVGKSERYFPGHPSVNSGKDWRIVAVIRPIEADYTNPRSMSWISRLIRMFTTTGGIVSAGGFAMLGAGLWYRYKR